MRYFIINIRICIILLFCMIGNFAYSQIYVTTTVKHICPSNIYGSIELQFDHAILQLYPMPYSAEWENLTDGGYKEFEINSLQYIIENLKAGDYEIIIYLDDNCEIFIEEEILVLPNSNIPLSVDKWDALIESQCEDGIIDLHIEGGTAPYTVHWEGDLGLNKIVSRANGLDGSEDLNPIRSGQYSVTVTDNHCGNGDLVVEIGCDVCPSLIYGIVHYGFIECEGKTGKLRVLLTELGVPPYEFLWSNGETTEIIENLQPDYYSVTVTDKRNCQSVLGMNLEVIEPPIVLNQNDFIVTDECENELSTGSIEFYYPYGPGYSYSWTGPNGFTSSSQDIDNLSSGEYCVEVRKDSNPECIYSKGCVSVGFYTNPVEIIEQGDACNPYNDGFITLRINNPNEVGVSVSYSWSPCPDCPTHPIIENNYSNSIEFTLTDLFEDEYTLYIVIGDCFFEYTFSIGREPDNLIYNDYEKRDGIIYCIYDVECRDNLDEMGYEKKAKAETYGIDCPFKLGHPFRGCGGVKYKCDNHVIESRNVRMVWMRRAEAIALALKLASTGVIIDSPEAIEFILGGDPCDRVLVCPNNPLCLGFVNKTSDFVKQVTIGNCTYFTCKFLWRSKFKICGLDYVPSYLRDYVEPDEMGGGEPECGNKVTRPLYWLVENYDLMAADMGAEFTNSTLSDFIALHTNNPKRWCAIVVYCCNTNEFVSSNIEDIGICESFYPEVTCGSFTESATCTISESFPETKIICPTNTTGIECPYSIKDRLTFPYTPSLKCPTTIHTFNDDVIIESLSISSNFSNFIPVPVDNGLMEPHALYSSDYGFFMESMANIDDIESLGIGIVKYQYDETQRIETGIIYEDGACWLRVNHQFEHFDAILPLDTNISSVYHLSKVDSTFFVVFGDKQSEFQHSYAESPQNSNFSILTYDHQLTLVDQKILEGQSLVSNAHSNNNVILVKKSLGDSSFELEAFDLNLGTVQSSINIIGDFEILDFDALSATNFAIVVSPTTAISINDTLNVPTNSNVSLIHVQGGNVRQQHLYLNSTQNHCVTMTPNQTLVLGLNVSDNDEVLLQGHNIPIQNPNDILTIYFDSVLNITGYKAYGTPSREEIFDMYWSENYLFFGGEISGTTSYRNMGRLNFWLLEPSINRPFISYDTLIPNSLIDTSNYPEELTTQHSFKKSEADLISLAPNPTSQTLVIQSYHTRPIKSTSVYTLEGKPISVNYTHSDLNNVRTLDVSGLNYGIYLVEIIHDDGLRCAKKVIKN